MRLFRRIREFLGLRKSVVGLLCMVVLVGMGERMAERFLPIYVIALGAGPIVVGLLNAMDNFLSAVYSFPGGYLAHRIGIKRSLLVFNALAAVGFLIVIWIPAWPAVIVGALFFLSWTAISLPATMGLLDRVLPRNKRTMGVSVQSFVRRVPMALGPIVGGLCIAKWGEEYGVRVAFGGALLMTIVAAVAQQILIEEDRSAGKQGASEREHNPLRLLRQMGRQITPELRNLLVSDILVRFCEQIPYAFVVLWCMKRISAPVTAPQFALLCAIEMTTAMLIYIPIAWLADRSAKKPFIVITFTFFTFFPLVLLYCQSFGLLAGAFILRGLKEFGEPARKALIMDLAPEGKKAPMFGLYYMIRDGVVSLAAFGGAFLWMRNPATNFITAFACGVAGTLWFAIRGWDTSPQVAR